MIISHKMAERDDIYSSKSKYVGVFSFSKFYEFCYNWVMSEIEPDEFDEKSYSEKNVGDAKNIDIVWKFSKKLTDYFTFEGSASFKTIMMKKVELNRNGKTVKANQGEISITVKGILVKDSKNKFESSSFARKLKIIYEKWIIASRIDQFEEKVFTDSDEFLEQTKAFLELEGRK